jgi:protocatechuate 3,4-dioxygenase beta subunit
MERKIFLQRSLGLIGISAIAVDACKKEAGSTTSTTGTDTSNISSDGCIVSPTETEGPYPYPDGGEINNPLQRADITGGQTGVALTLKLAIVNADDSCAAVENARVDIWHCNKDGYYSGYANQNGLLGTKNYTSETWLRGYQLTDANGQVTFTTIYPGWYSGRATHIHIEVYVNNVMKKTTQIAFPESVNNKVYASSLYAAHGANTTSNAADSIFGNSTTDLANETVTITGSVDAGYVATQNVGLSL